MTPLAPPETPDLPPEPTSEIGSQEETEPEISPDDLRKMQLDHYLQRKVDYIREVLKLRRHELHVLHAITEWLHPTTLCVPTQSNSWGSMLLVEDAKESPEAYDARQEAKIAAYRRLCRIFYGDILSPAAVDELLFASAVVAEDFDESHTLPDAPLRKSEVNDPIDPMESLDP